MQYWGQSPHYCTYLPMRNQIRLSYPSISYSFYVKLNNMIKVSHKTFISISMWNFCIIKNWRQKIKLFRILNILEISFCKLYFIHYLISEEKPFFLKLLNFWGAQRFVNTLGTVYLVFIDLQTFELVSASALAHPGNWWWENLPACIVMVDFPTIRLNLTKAW